ncbi:AMP-binding protein [Streptomyces lunaelactis]|uniref:Bagremycin synthetase n=1 Tax=Streptomyces lunaelactis TaxID=1535768 RepID=A0A2P1AAZ3_9ACTN|nr:bagremycin/ferroverdin synthetase BagE/FevW [Streptomyces lunaelactis]AVI10276.1 bagremycin synthetase [Streptomyces lunaelactis]NUK08375.1 AMP-binding protein [Streptomyces lunaelactis]NUK59635.1 AMP-binding protein [Streptomyces lunaelactis]NUL09970.1 AMP-binding protein [Streptomyces lunaelactis]NUL22344.1 AMP-binding protein [Streptomyces lunaelactis]
MTVSLNTELTGSRPAGSGLPAIGDWTTFDELRAAQDERIAPALHHARNSPFYEKRLESGQTLSAVGLTGKSDLRDSYPFGMLAVPRERLATYHESSGSTGNPTPAYFTEAEWTDLADRFVRKTVPIGPEDTMLVRIPYGLVLAGHMAHWAAMRSGATVVPGDCRSLAVPYSRVVRLLHDLEVTLTWSTPSESLLWVAAAKAAGYPAGSFPALRALYVAGEPISSARRRRIEEIWGALVIEEYGCTEVGPLASDCPYGRMHFWADRVLPEIYDPQTGDITAEGTGQLVITPLYREAMPLLRYNLEDLVDLRYEDCPCDWKLPTVRVLGRLGQGYTVGGKRLGQIQVEELVYRLPASLGVLFWRARAEQDRLVVEIEVPGPDGGDAAALLAASVKEELGVRCAVSAVPEGTLVPSALLAEQLDAMKPRKLFGPDEDWGQAIVRG